ncbi:MAG: hypothetical protein P8M78_11940 [Myxococcota bacterium]|nr:hypothetical protein [Myxococcota bacterium]
MTDESQNRGDDPDAALPRVGKKGAKRVLILEENGIARPYMRGIMVHSLMARGFSFEIAYETANDVADHIRGRRTVKRSEISTMVSERLGGEYEHQPPIPIPITVEVENGRGLASFSKGTLSQSLLAASIEPDVAFEVAKEIEVGLIADGLASVTREELRSRAYRQLAHRFGRRTAERYLVWREFEEPDKPVILLLGGAAGVGKTSLALAVAQRLGIRRVLSTDSIRNVMRLTLSSELMPALHASSFNAHRGALTPGENEEALVEGFMDQSRAVSVGARAIVERAIEENTSLVLDGVSLVPGLIDLEAYRSSAHIYFLLVARLDEDAFRGHFELRAKRQKHRQAARYVERMSEILTIQEWLLELADRYQTPIVDNITLEGSTLLVIRHVVESLRKESARELTEVD